MYFEQISKLLEKRDKALIANLYENFSASVIWYKPIYDTFATNLKVVVDLEIQYCNNLACAYLGKTKQEILGVRLKTTELTDNVSRKLIFQNCCAVLYSEEQKYHAYYNEYLSRFIQTVRRKVLGGVVSITESSADYYFKSISNVQPVSTYNYLL